MTSPVPRNGPSPVQLLARSDKWQLSAGEGLIWAPTSPVWRDAPGFWDEAHLFHYPVAPLFTVSFVDGTGIELVPRPLTPLWTPASLEMSYRLAPWLEAAESRVVLPGFVLGSEWVLTNTGSAPAVVHAVAWTAAPGEEVSPDSVEWSSVELVWPRTLRDRHAHTLAVAMKLALARGADSWAAYRAEAIPNHPHFHLTPFWDRWDPLEGGLGNRAELAGISAAGLVYLGIHRRIELGPSASARLAVALRLEPDLPAAARSTTEPAEAPSRPSPVPPAPAEPSVAGPRKAATFAVASRAAWESYFTALPEFRCSDPYFEHYWAYRWFALRLSAIAGGIGNYSSPTVCEGVGYFHVPISYSAQCHLRELRWARDPEWARGVLRTFLAHQAADGSLPGRIYANHQGADFYHADWGGALSALDAVHPDDDFLREVLPALARYGEWLIAQRDANGTGLFDVVDQFETGQEYMSRYLAVDPEADRYGWENRLRLKGVDSTVYAYSLMSALARLGARGGIPTERWKWLAKRTATVVRQRMWDPAAQMFSDVNPKTRRRTGVRAAVSFYPYATDIVRSEHLAGLVRNLFDPAQFWTPFPVPSTSASDPLYSPHAAWKGKRHHCPWNGRVWPMTNSHVVEAVAALALGPLPPLRAHLVELITKFVRMMFWDGDASRPNSFEHYHPLTGRPSAYRGVDDYLHSWVNDHIVQYVIGLRPAPGRGDRFVVDPMPFGLEDFHAVGLPMRGMRVDVSLRDRHELRVWVDGREAARGPIGHPLEVAP